MTSFVNAPLRLRIGSVTVLIELLCKVMVKVRVTTKVPVRIRDQKPISRDYELASELLQAQLITSLVKVREE